MKPAATDTVVMGLMSDYLSPERGLNPFILPVKPLLYVVAIDGYKRFATAF